MIPSWIRERATNGLRPEDRERVLDAARRGEEWAQEKIVLGHSRLVAKAVLDLNRTPSEDLYQEGIVGLLAAVQRYRPEFGTKFSTYATYWVRYFIQRAQAGLNWEVKVPLRSLRAAARIRATEERLAQRFGRTPSDDEIARELGWKASRLARLRREALVTCEAERFEGNVETVASPLERYLERETIQRIQKEVAALPERVRNVVVLRYGIGRGRGETLSEIGARLGISPEAVRQMERRALARLQTSWLREEQRAS
jgi:RNA polymerase primary sigma factor